MQSPTPAQPIQPPDHPPIEPFDPAVLATLACPACRADLRLEPAHLICIGCGRAYPIVDGIPALIAERVGGSLPNDVA